MMKKIWSAVACYRFQKRRQAFALQSRLSPAFLSLATPEFFEGSGSVSNMFVGARHAVPLRRRDMCQIEPLAF
jgi:hypothetical protein